MHARARPISRRKVSLCDNGTATRGSRIRMCESGRARRGRGREGIRAEGRKAQVTTGPPCSERNRIFFYFLRFHIRLVRSRVACSVRKRDNMYGRVKSGVQSQPRPYNRIIHVIHALIAEGTRRQRQYMIVRDAETAYVENTYAVLSYLQGLFSDFVKFLFADYKIKRIWIYADYTWSEIREFAKNMWWKMWKPCSPCDLVQLPLVSIHGELWL